MIAALAARTNRETGEKLERLWQSVSDFDQERQVSPQTSREEQWRKSREKVQAKAEELRRALDEMTAAASSLDPDVEFDPALWISGDEAQVIDLRTVAAVRAVPPRVEDDATSPERAEIRKALLVNARLAQLGKIPTEARLRDALRAEEAKHGQAVDGEIRPSRGRGAPREKRDDLVGELGRRYGGDLSALETLSKEQKKPLAARLGTSVRTLERALDELTARVALGL
jgi:hypothetical protein